MVLCRGDPAGTVQRAIAAAAFVISAEPSSARPAISTVVGDLGLPVVPTDAKCTLVDISTAMADASRAMAVRRHVIGEHSLLTIAAAVAGEVLLLSSSSTTRRPQEDCQP